MLKYPYNAETRPTNIVNNILIVYPSRTPLVLEGTTIISPNNKITKIIFVITLIYVCYGCFIKLFYSPPDNFALYLYSFNSSTK